MTTVTEAIKQEAIEYPPMLRAHAVLRTIQILMRPVYKSYWRLHVHSPGRVPKSGPVILAANHRSHLDSIIMPYITWRPVNFMAKSECFEQEIGARMLRSLAVFPVNRGSADKGALRKALTTLEAGGVLGIYPEGTRGAGPELGEIHRGTAWLAAQSGAVVIPVGLGGTEAVMSKRMHFPRPRKVRVVVGEPMRPPATSSKAELQQFTKGLQQQLQSVFDKAGGPGPLRG